MTEEEFNRLRQDPALREMYPSLNQTWEQAKRALDTHDMWAAKVHDAEKRAAFVGEVLRLAPQMLPAELEGLPRQDEVFPMSASQDAVVIPFHYRDDTRQVTLHVTASGREVRQAPDMGVLAKRRVEALLRVIETTPPRDVI